MDITTLNSKEVGSFSNIRTENKTHDKGMEEQRINGIKLTGARVIKSGL